jgi:hypothetical protein
MPTEEQCEASYHCGIDKLLRAAYQREFTMMKMGKCKTKFPTFMGVVRHTEPGAAATGG